MNEVHVDPNVRRLELSREHLRQALNGGAAHASTKTEAQRHARRSRSPSRWWLEAKALPVAGKVLEAAEKWWANHPSRATTTLAFHTAQVVIAPLAQRHPIALVSGALVVGGWLAWQRPWRWVLRRSLIATLVPTVLAGLLPQLLLALLTAQARAEASRQAGRVEEP